MTPTPPSFFHSSAEGPSRPFLKLQPCVPSLFLQTDLSFHQIKSSRIGSCQQRISLGFHKNSFSMCSFLVGAWLCAKRQAFLGCLESFLCRETPVWERTQMQVPVQGDIACPSWVSVPRKQREMAYVLTCLFPIWKPQLELLFKDTSPDPVPTSCLPAVEWLYEQKTPRNHQAIFSELLLSPSLFYCFEIFLSPPHIRI